MANRKKDVYKTAIPLYQLIEQGSLTRASIVKSLAVSNQTITNWLARGVPAARLTEVAEVCGMNTDEYRYNAGMSSRLPVGGKSLSIGIEGLPKFMRAYLQAKAEDMLRHYQSVPEWIRARLEPPADPKHYELWREGLEVLLAHMSNLPTEKKSKAKA